MTRTTRRAAGLAAALAALAVAAPAAADPVREGRLVAAEAGDAACYLTIVDAKGARHAPLADFPLCEQTDLIGKTVRLRYRKTQVLAASCEGDPDCAERDTVDLAVEATPLR